MEQYSRSLTFPEASFFLWGPRQSGKTTLLRHRLPESRFIDLLHTDQRIRFEREPFRLREEVLAQPQGQITVIDEIQKVPALLDEVHGLIEAHGRGFVLCGSSARKIRRTHANLLGGRALRRELLGLSAHEIGADFSLEQMLNSGPLPPHYLSNHPDERIEAYVDLYLKEEILDEGLNRNLPVFSDFLRSAAIGDTEVTNFSNIARECGVAASTVRGYYEILEDTLLGAFLPAYTRRAKRRTTHSPKFYFRDVGIVNHLAKRGRVQAGSEIFGKAFENWVFHELSVYARSVRPGFEMAYWRLTTGVEVDFVLGEAEVAIEVKGKARVHRRDVRNLLEFKKEHPSVKQLVLVCLEELPRITHEGIRILPWSDFLKALWSGEFTNLSSM